MAPVPKISAIAIKTVHVKPSVIVVTTSSTSAKSAQKIVLLANTIKTVMAASDTVSIVNPAPMQQRVNTTLLQAAGIRPPVAPEQTAILTVKLDFIVRIANFKAIRDPVKLALARLLVSFSPAMGV